MILTGTVIAGKKRGRELGFPTANIVLDSNVEPGVYRGDVFFGEKKWNSAVYIHPDRKLLEAHLLDFEGDLYGETIRVELREKIRDPEIFDSVEALKEQIARDVERIRELNEELKIKNSLYAK